MNDSENPSKIIAEALERQNKALERIADALETIVAMEYENNG